MILYEGWVVRLEQICKAITVLQADLGEQRHVQQLS